MLELGDDQERRDLGLERYVAGDEDHRAVFAHRARERECEAGKKSRQDVRENHPDKGLPARCAEARGGLLQLAFEIFEHGLDGANDERQANESQRDDHPERCECDFQPERRERLAKPAVLRIDRRQRDARHRGWKRER